MKLRGPHCLGRSVVVSPWQATPVDWSTARRIDVSKINSILNRLPDNDNVLKGLRRAWQEREALIIECPDFRVPSNPGFDNFWDLEPISSPPLEDLDFYVFANAVDLRDIGKPRFRPWDLALQSGAKRSDEADIIAPSGEHYWIDGGPLQVIEHEDLMGHGVVPRIHLQQKSFQTLHRASVLSSSLAVDQIAAVQHVSGPARIIAPAGSGKTRVITERVRHMVAQGISVNAITVVAYNKRAQEEILSRLSDLPGASVKTLHALAREVLGKRGISNRAPSTINEIEVREILIGLVPAMKRRANTDPIEAWVDAAAFARDTLSSPAEVVASFPDVSNFAKVINEYRGCLQDQNIIDFPEMVLLACEALLLDEGLRRKVRSRVGTLLVDEFQDLTPLLLLFVRLLAGPANEIFCVGDDDQTIYGYSGASPDWLVNFEEYFANSDQYALTVNYRCPGDVVQAAVNLLKNNTHRVQKHIQSSPSQRAESGLSIVNSESPDQELLRVVTQQLEESASTRDIAVLARVNASLLGPYLVLSGSGIACRRPIGMSQEILSRNGVASLLAWIDIAASAKRPFSQNSIALALKRPRISASPAVLQIVATKTDLGSIQTFVNGNKNLAMRQSLMKFVDDCKKLQSLVENGATTLDVITHVLDTIGLAESCKDLDNSQRVARKTTHFDELQSIKSIAGLESDPAKFVSFVWDVLSRGGNNPDGITFETVHRVKGQEWANVHVVRAIDNQMPHQLSVNIEEERRIFHVAITRCLKTCTVYVDGNESASPFVAELGGGVSAIKAMRVSKGSSPSSTSTSKQTLKVGDKVVQIVNYDNELFETLKEWRQVVAKQNRWPAYTVLNDATLKEIASVKPRTKNELRKIKGIGPTKLELYSDEVLEMIESSL